MKNIKTKSAVLISLILPAVAMAHPGHNHATGVWETVQHIVVSFAPFAVVLGIVVGIGIWLHNNRKPRKVRVRK